MCANWDCLTTAASFFFEGVEAQGRSLEGCNCSLVGCLIGKNNSRLFRKMKDRLEAIGGFRGGLELMWDFRVLPRGSR